MKKMGSRRGMSLDIGWGCVVFGGLFLPVSEIKIRIRPTGKNGDILRGKKRAFHRQICERRKDLSPVTYEGLSLLELTHALTGISFRRKEPTPHALVSRSDICHQKWRNIQVGGRD
jgi:hypothetical protein